MFDIVSFIPRAVMQSIPLLLGSTGETRGGEGKSVCKNGPVFDATEVFF